ncbi:MAG: type I restriction-modification system subunit M [Carboxylicivirga sp.]|nr:type I restriction-modification system subunit M [Carboxylicivirga sp.]
MGYFIAYENLFSTWLELGNDFDVSNVTDALSAFSRLIHPEHKKLFDGVFKTLETGLSKLGESAGARTKAISKLVHLIKDIPMDGKQDYDVLGFIYEYLIEKFAANAGKKAGEFYTPHEVSLLMSEITAHHLKDKTEIQIYDPTSGSGSLLINIGTSVSKYIDDSNNIKYYAQELKENTYNLTRMNLIMRGILPNNIVTRNGDTLEDDWPYFEENDPTNTYNTLLVDAVVSNPPYSQKWESEHKETDPRYARFGLAPKTKADYAFLLHDLYHLKHDGIMTIVLPHGVLFRGGEEGNIRKNLIENNHIETIIGLPANIFFGTGIPTIILVLRQKRSNSDVLIVDASKGFKKEGKNNKLRASDIKRIADTVIQRKDLIPKYSKLVKKDEIRANDYNLNIPRYVDSSANAESWDIYATMFGGIPSSEIDELSAYWEAFPSLRQTLFTEDAYNNAKLIGNNIKNSITQHPEVDSFINDFNTSFESFNGYLKSELLDNMLSLTISKQEAKLSDDIFARLKDTPLIDKYEAYQLLDDQWLKIAVDLEIIQTEGKEVLTKVDPYMVLKKVKGKEAEVQDGWKGRIMPFTLVQETYLQEELQAIQAKENRLAEITSAYETTLESLSEEDKENDTINENKDAFVNAVVIKEAKKFKAEVKKTAAINKESYEAQIIKVSELITEEKKVKKQLAEEKAALHLLTKETIENLSQEQITELLERKWITPLEQNLHSLPQTLIAGLTNHLETLSEKYAETYTDIVEGIQETENELGDLMDELIASQSDMAGLNAFKELLKSDTDE